MSHDQLLSLGFVFEFLPSGRINIGNLRKFSLNGIPCINPRSGQWIRTLEVKSVNDAVSYIKTVEFLD